MRVLLIEDDDMFGEATKAGLEQEAHAVDWVTKAEEAKAALFSQAYDVVLLDLGLPDGEGTEVLRDLRANRNDVSVLIMTARDTLTDKISGLDAGADDYLVKPFDLNELCARIRAVSRRKDTAVSCPEIQYANLKLDPKSLKAWYKDSPIDLGPKEFRILQKLVEKKEQIVRKETLEDLLYSWDHEIESNAIEVHMHRIRKKLGKNLIKTIRGMGYKIEDTS